MSGSDKPLMIVYRTACKPYKAAWAGNTEGAPALWFTKSSPGGITLTKQENCEDTAAPPTPSPNGPRKIGVAATTTVNGTWAASYHIDGAGCLLRPMDPTECRPKWFSEAATPSGYRTKLTAKASVILPEGASKESLDRPNLRCTETADGMQRLLLWSATGGAEAEISVKATGPEGAGPTGTAYAEAHAGLKTREYRPWEWFDGDFPPQPDDWPEWTDEMPMPEINGPPVEADRVPGYTGADGVWDFDAGTLAQTTVKEIVTPWWITEITVSVTAKGLDVKRWEYTGADDKCKLVDTPTKLKARFEFSAELSPV